jgi:xanthine dehydrogenase YagS FAD-binding subunit
MPRASKPSNVTKKAEEYLEGKALELDTVETAAQLALQDAKPLSKNEYKIEIAKSLIKKTLLACK